MPASHQRPAGPPRVAPLRTGDLVRVTCRTGSGHEHWTGTVTDVDDRLRMATISDGRRNQRAAVRGATYINVLIPAAERLDITDETRQPAYA